MSDQEEFNMKREPGLASDPCAVNEHDQFNIYTPEISLASENTVPTVFTVQYYFVSLSIYGLHARTHARTHAHTHTYIYYLIIIIII